MKRGQVEIMGLLIIVVLLLFAGMIFLRFYLMKPASSLPDLRKNIQVTDMLTAVMHSTYQERRMSEALIICQEEGTCAAVQQELTQIFRTIVQQGQKYGFLVKKNEEPLFMVADGCDIGIVSSYPMTKGEDTYEARLIFC